MVVLLAEDFVVSSPKIAVADVVNGGRRRNLPLSFGGKLGLRRLTEAVETHPRRCFVMAPISTTDSDTRQRITTTRMCFV